MKGVILAGGKAEDSLCQLFGDIPTALVPVNGKPIIFFIIDNFIEVGIKNIYIAVGYKEKNIKSIINNYFSKKANIIFISVDHKKKPGTSLFKVSKEIGNSKALITLADSYLKLNSKMLHDLDRLYTSINILNSQLWCTVELNQDSNIIKFYDKKRNKESYEALVGVYVLSEIDKLIMNLDENKNYEISDLLKNYIKYKSLKTTTTEEWLDFGHLQKYQISKKSLLSKRFFNSLEFNNFLGTITKRSNVDKFLDEIRWQVNLPKELKILAPRVIDYSLDKDNAFIEMEYYSYQTVSEIWLYSFFDEVILNSIVDKIWKVLLLFSKEKRVVSKDDYNHIYKEKTISRISTLICLSKEFLELFNYQEVVINGQSYKNWNLIKDEILEKVDELYSPKDNSLIHGDFCFSNILYDMNSSIVRVIDPRGMWGSSENGDIKYDIAKLRHSISGGYDFIVNDLFIVDLNKNNISYKLFMEDKHFNVADSFDKKISTCYDLNHIKLIEGLLFISMLPYHSDNLNRQFVLYANAIKLLNGVLK